MLKRNAAASYFDSSPERAPKSAVLRAKSGCYRSEFNVGCNTPIVIPISKSALPARALCRGGWGVPAFRLRPVHYRPR
ncbi:hypothetical protein EVAR_94647_1 [Eumeta japonica]|uniref:Uncharacterized protein n=1 Tax=Eumeta variegata TaxID=151549 RepID=A0A4C1UUV9_EUMVA|nr:hypothetical protein EVAR_94647_1 [Eumeta japonica]